MTQRKSPQPVVAAVTQGYGHLRAAAAVADALGVEVTEVDRRPFAGRAEHTLWTLARVLYVALSRLSQTTGVGPPFRRLLDRVTAIPDTFEAPRLAAREVALLDRLIRLGLCRRLALQLDATGAVLLSTFYAPALAVDRWGKGSVGCLVTDTDAHRVWGPTDPSSSRVIYLAPTRQVEARLGDWGIPAERVILTGFPLPPELSDPDAAAAAFARRMSRLEPTTPSFDPSRREDPPRLTVAIGGAGAQADRGHRLTSSLGPLVAEGRLRLTLVAGTNASIAASFRRFLRQAGIGGLPPGHAEVLFEPTFAAYYRRFNARLADTDILWTKPSELSFYAALGIALVLDDPVGDHERRNRDWLLERGAAVLRREPEAAHRWLARWIADGRLAVVGRNGFARLPRSGTQRIVTLLQSDFTAR